MTYKILISGGSGLFSVNAAIEMREIHEVILAIHTREISLNNITSVRLNLEEADVCKKTLTEIMPNLVIHAAGMTNVEDCEKNPRLAEFINIDLGMNIARAAHDLTIPFVYISTDHLFSGKKLLSHEFDTPEPLNVYAKTKWGLEKNLIDAGFDPLIVRTNFYGWGTSYRKSFSDYIIDSLRESKSVTLFEDVFYTPIIISRLVEIILMLVDRNATGIFNIVSDERISKFEFGMKIAKEFGLNRSLIKNGSITKNSNLIARPLDMSLSNAKVSKFLNIKVGGISEHLTRLKMQEQAGIAKEWRKL